jgi:hypothetical protein
MSTRGRRLITAVASGVLVLAGVGACRSEPAVAAYVGDVEFTTADVESYYTELRSGFADRAAAEAAERERPGATPAPTPAAEAPVTPVSRQDVLAALVGRELARSAAAAKRLEPVAITAEQVSEALGLPAGSRYAQVYAEFQSYLEALLRNANAAEPSEADLRDVLDRLVAGGLQAPETTLADFRASIGNANLGLVARSAQVRDELVAQAGQADLAINPRYAPAQIALLQTADARNQPYPLVVVPLRASGAPSPAVVDVS